MSELTINDVRVVLRDKFPARFGWDLLPVVRRIDKARVLAAEVAEDGVDFMGIVLAELTFEEIVTFVRGAVESWGFPGDLATDGCCDELDPLTEMLPLATQAVLLFYTANSREKLSGEAGSGSTLASEG